MTSRYHSFFLTKLCLVALALLAMTRPQDLVAESLSLLLIDSQGSGIAGQQVELLTSNGSSTDRQTFTDANGLAVFDVELDVRYRMRVYHNGGSYQTKRVRADDLVEVETARSDLRLRNSQNGGIAGQRVELLTSDSSPTGVEGVTDAGGVAGFEILPSVRHRFRVYHNGGNYISARVTYGRDATVRTRASQLRLRDSDNDGIGDQRVELLLEDGTPTGVEGVTDAGGVAAFEILPNYRHRFRVYHNGGNYISARVTYGRDATVRTRASRLRLRDSDNDGIGDQRVELLLADGSPTGFENATNATGRTSFEILPKYAHRYLVHHNGGTYITKELVHGDDAEVRTRLSELHLMDSGDSGIGGQRVELILSNGAPTGFESTTDGTGRMSFEILPTYAHRYLVHHNGGTYSTEELVYGDDVEVQTQLSELTLLDIVEHPVSGVQVELVRADGTGTGLTVLTDADGRGDFEILPTYAHLFAMHFEGEIHLSEVLVYGEDTVFILPAEGLYLFMRRTTALYNTALRLPLLVRGNVDQDIFSAETFIVYDRTLLAPSAVELAGSQTEGWALERHITSGPNDVDTLKIAAATAADPLLGPGVLYHIDFAVADRRSPGSSVLGLEHVLFNNGDPVPFTADGWVKIVGHDGSIRARFERVPPNQSIEVAVEDVDENRDDQMVETLTVVARNSGQQERLTVTETGAASGLFTGSIAAEFSQQPIAGDGIVQVEGEDDVELCYIDSLDAGGQTIERCAQVRVRPGRDAHLRVTVVSQPGDTVWVRLTDGDLNLDPLTAEIAVVQGAHAITDEREDVVLTERSADDSVFFGRVPTSSRRRDRRDQDGVFWTQRDEELVFTFEDESTAQGAAAQVQQRHQVIGRFGDADGDNRLRSKDEQRILQHALGLSILSGADSLAANVDRAAPFGPITPEDAALVRQRRQRQISRFPVQERTAANQPQPETETAKGAGDVRRLSLVDRGDYLVIVVDERAGISSGDLFLEGITGRVEAVLDKFTALSREDGSGLRLVFAGGPAAAGPGDLLRIYAAEHNDLPRLARAELNDGRLQVSLGGMAGAEILPTTFALYANAPNPFNPQTAIRFDLPQAETVRLEVYDVLGRKVRALIQSDLPPGIHRVIWNGRDSRGRQVGSGVYFYRLEAGAYTQTRRMLLLE